MNGYKCANEGKTCYCNGIVKYGKPPFPAGEEINVDEEIDCDESDGCWCIPNSKFEVLTVL